MLREHAAVSIEQTNEIHAAVEMCAIDTDTKALRRKRHYALSEERRYNDTVGMIEDRRDKCECSIRRIWEHARYKPSGGIIHRCSSTIVGGVCAAPCGIVHPASCGVAHVLDCSYIVQAVRWDVIAREVTCTNAFAKQALYIDTAIECAR